MPLTLRETMWASDGPNLTHDNPVQFRVVGLPTGRDALIGTMRNRWQILRTGNGTSSGWLGDFESKEAALAALEKSFSPPGDRIIVELSNRRCDIAKILPSYERIIARSNLAFDDAREIAIVGASED